MKELELTYIDRKGSYRTGITCNSWVTKKGAYIRLLGDKKRKFIRKKKWIGEPKPRKENK